MPLKLLRGIRKFKNTKFKEKEPLFKSLSQGQSPEVLLITCSDSRIVPTEVTDSNVGELFIIRNAGNIISPPHTTSGEGATLEFALHALNIKEIIVCGHSQCGAMKGLMSPDIEKSMPHVAKWLDLAREVMDGLYTRHPELERDPSLTLTKIIQDNILLQIERLKTYPVVAAGLRENKLTIYGWYYEFEVGEVYIYNPVKKAFISFEQTVDEVAQKKLSDIIQRVNNKVPTFFANQNVLLFAEVTKELEEIGLLYEKPDGTRDRRWYALLDQYSAQIRPHQGNDAMRYAPLQCRL